jgi:flavodoxin
MKTLIACLSYSGNTRKVAEAILGEAGGDADLLKMEEVRTLEGYDLVFVGFPIHGFSVPEEARKFLQKLCRGKTIALFITHAAPEHSPDLPPWLEKCRETAIGAEVIGVFNSQGELGEEVADYLLKSDNPKYRAWGSHRDSTRGQPDEARLEKARKFARDMVAGLPE